VISFDEFVKKWTGKTIDFDGIYPNQCMDLSHFYVYEVLGYTDKYLLAAPAAYQVYTNFKSEWEKYFTKIDNTPDNIPSKGDIIFWGTKIGQYGHVAIFVEGDAIKFKSFDSNWPVGTLPHIQEHDYKGCLGWLRPRTVGYNCEEKLEKVQKAFDGLQDDYIKLKSELDKTKQDLISFQNKSTADLNEKQAHVDSLQKTGAEMTAQLSSMQRSYGALQEQLKSNLEAHRALEEEFKSYKSLNGDKLTLSEQFYQQSLETIREASLEISKLKEKVEANLKGHSWFRLLLELFIRPFRR